MARKKHSHNSKRNRRKKVKKGGDINVKRRQKRKINDTQFPPITE